MTRLRAGLVAGALLGLAGHAAAQADHPLAVRRAGLRQETPAQLSGAWTTSPAAVPLPTIVLTADAYIYLIGPADIGPGWRLVPEKWTTNGQGTVLRFSDDGPLGAVRIRIVASRGGTVLTFRLRHGAFPSTTSPASFSTGPFHVRLAVAGATYCSMCGPATAGQDGRFAARDCPAPPTCFPAAPTTTTSTSTTSSTTTTTLVPGVCGNGMLNTGEDCDLPAYVPEACITDPSFEVLCEPPGSRNECRCCPRACLALPGPGFCCPGRRCVNGTGAGSFQSGTCVGFTCVSAADCCEPGGGCSTYDCADGACCARAGNLCADIGCCPGSTCQIFSEFIRRCCLPTGSACTANAECCSSSCNVATTSCD